VLNQGGVMGERKRGPLRVEFDREIKLEFHGAKVSSDGGLLIYRELDEALGLTDLAETMLSELRVGKNTQHTLKALLRQSVYSRLAGYEDTNDAERLRVDPTIRRVVGGVVRKNGKRHRPAKSVDLKRSCSRPTRT